MMRKQEEDSDGLILTSSESEGATDEVGATDATERLLELVELAREETSSNEAAASPLPARIAGVVVGRLLGTDPPKVLWTGPSRPVAARSMVPLDAATVGREVALMFEEQDPARPLIIGLMEPTSPVARASTVHSVALQSDAPIEVTADEKRVVVEAADELVLRCGKASITLTKSGKILIKGAYVSSTASGTNRIRGGAVEIN